MRDSNYAIFLRNWDGRILLEFPAFISLEYARSFNTVGALSVTVPGYYPDVQRDMQLVVLRSVFDHTPYRDANTVWFVTGWDYSFDDNVTTIHCADALLLLRKRVVAYRGNTLQATKTIENGNPFPADIMARQFVRENLGTDAHPTEFPTGGTRVMRGFQIEPDPSAGGRFPVTEKDAPFRNLFDVVNEIASEQQDSGRMMLFDVIPSDNAEFTFRIFEGFLGSDRRGKVSFGPVYGNMTNASISVDWTDFANVVYVGGEGEDESRCIAPVTSSTLVNGVGTTPYQRTEAFLDMRDTECGEVGDPIMEAEGRSFLARNRSRLTAEGQIINTPQSTYGRDFFYGDMVSCDFGVYAFDAVISAIHVTVSFNEEVVEISLSSEME